MSVQMGDSKAGTSSSLCVSHLTREQITMRTHLKRKQVDDVMGGKEAWANVDRTESQSLSWRKRACC